MDCCSKYPDYRHHLIGGGGDGGPVNGSYYSHAHPSIRYQQTMYRLTPPNPGGFNGIGPPAVATPSLYPNYERYGSFSNLPPYVYNTNGFGYGNYGREVSGYYGQYEGLNRGGVGFSYHNYRNLHDAAGLHGPRGAGYHTYPPHPPTGREMYPGHGTASGFHTHPGTTGHQHPHQNHLHHYNAPKDSFMSQISDIGSGGCNEPRGRETINDGNSFNSNITASSSLVNGNAIQSCVVEGAMGAGLGHADYSGLSATYHNNNGVSDRRNTIQQQHAPQTSPHGIHPISTGYPYGLKDSKQRKCSREKDKYFTSPPTPRRMDCATPLDTSSNYDRAETPFTPHPTDIKSPPINPQSRLPSNYIPSPNHSNGNLSPFPNSPSSWTQQCSPRPVRKRSFSPRPQPSPKPPLTPNKSRVLECDFIPCKKSRKKILAESSEDSYELREEIKNITPLPGFQQAFGSTEIGRFSEVFLNTPESPYEQLYESEADTLSPQPWETGDSLEGPHFNLHIGASVQPVYLDNNTSIDSPVDGGYFSGIRCSNY